MKSIRAIDLLALLIVVGASVAGCTNGTGETSRLIDDLGIDVTNLENREFSYTDKKSGYFYGRTHRPDSTNWFAGWNVGTRRILRDYRIMVGGGWLDREAAAVRVFPHKLVRRYPRATETLRLFDHEAVLSITLETASPDSMALTLVGDYLSPHPGCGFGACFISDEAPDQIVGVTTFAPAKLTVKRFGDEIRVTDSSASGGFLIALAPDADSLETLLERARSHQSEWTAERESRMEQLVAEDSFFESDDDSLTAAVRWIQLTLDQLIMQQTGYGIYAGLPWFNDYWGRDLFITLPGATLVSGQFDVAANVLRSFAGYQNLDEGSPDYGRVPNRLRPDEIIYNTTDGTPRFVIALYDYLRYSGDTGILSDLFPAVKRSIEGPLRYWADERGYLTHHDADTWMDAKLDGRIPWSPRGNRAVDIQALWYDQLRYGAQMARLVGDDSSAARWTDEAELLASHFEEDFLPRDETAQLADRLMEDGTPDFTFRPNQLFALDLLGDDSLKMAITRKAWESLVYPWGVASLSQMDDNFHPWHEAWEYYPKDAAYHNGTVWLWNNGIAMQRMLEAHRPDIAYSLFEGMSRQALHSGAVGSLSENMDALPRADADWARRSGTFLQAWSNAEYLRVWYQYFLGVRPDALEHHLVLSPQIPGGLRRVAARVRIAAGRLNAQFDRTDEGRDYLYQFEGFNTSVTLRLPGYADLDLKVSAGDRVEVVVGPENARVTHRSTDGSSGAERILTGRPADSARAVLEAQIFDGVDFAKPYLRPDLKALGK